MPAHPCLFVACAPSGSRIHPPYVKLFRKNCPAESTRIVERPKNQGPEQLQATVHRILAAQPLHPERVPYYLEKRDPEFEAKRKDILLVYQEVALQNGAQPEDATPRVITVSVDEKPGLQALANTAPDLPPVAGKYPTVGRDHEYQRLGTCSILAALDLHDGHIRQRHAALLKLGGRQTVRTADGPRRPWRFPVGVEDLASILFLVAAALFHVIHLSSAARATTDRRWSRCGSSAARGSAARPPSVCCRESYATRHRSGLW